MVDYGKHKQVIVNQFTSAYGKEELPLSIVIVTYNRLVYLQKCISSLLASTSVPHQILVVDDGSTDGTVEWLKGQLKRGKVHKVVFNKAAGTANNFNMGIEAVPDYCDWAIIANDDMYFHRWWDLACMEILAERAGALSTLTFYDYTNNKVKDERSEKLFRTHVHITGSGLGASWINKDVFTRAGCFRIKGGKRMGFFASSYCAAANKAAPNMNHAMTVPNWATHMDNVACPLSERDQLQSYIEHRQIHKKGGN